MNLPANTTDAQQEKTQIKEDVQNNGMVRIPDPLTLKNDWMEAPMNIPDTMYI